VADQARRDPAGARARCCRLVLGHGVAAALVLLVAHPAPALPPDSTVARALEARIDRLAADAADPSRLRSPQLVAGFYRGRGFEPAWTSSRGPRPALLELLDVVRRAADDAISPDYLRVPALESAAERARSASHRANGPAAAPTALLVDLELLASDAYLTYATLLAGDQARDQATAAPPDQQDEDQRRDGDQNAGRGESVTDAPPSAAHSPPDPVARLERALAPSSGRDAIASGLRELLPENPGYRRLRAALPTYRRIAHDRAWLEVPEGRPLMQGNREVRVPILRARLAAEPGISLDVDGAPSRYFDLELDRAVRAFQQRHGLDPDGVAGGATIAALNVSADDRIRQMMLNMDRLRRKLADPSPRSVEVNVAAAELLGLERGRQVLQMRVVVGEPQRPTPLLDSEITHFVINPYWNVPRAIALETLIPAARDDPYYLGERGFRVVMVDREQSRDVDPDEVDWDLIDPRSPNVRLRQEPGPQNALGRMKFAFPNRYAVYLHDTPTRSAFERAARSRSHGCVRVERPIELAAFLTGGGDGWDSERLEKVTASGSRHVVHLPRPVPLHLTYQTAWADDDGTVHFRQDVYGIDEKELDLRRIAR